MQEIALQHEFTLKSHVKIKAVLINIVNKNVNCVSSEKVSIT